MKRAITTGRTKAVIGIPMSLVLPRRGEESPGKSSKSLISNRRLRRIPAGYYARPAAAHRRTTSSPRIEDPSDLIEPVGLLARAGLRSSLSHRSGRSHEAGSLREYSQASLPGREGLDCKQVGHRVELLLSRAHRRQGPDFSRPVSVSSGGCQGSAGQTDHRTTVDLIPDFYGILTLHRLLGRPEAMELFGRMKYQKGQKARPGQSSP